MVCHELALGSEKQCKANPVQCQTCSPEEEGEERFPGAPYLVPFEGDQRGQFFNCILLNSSIYPLGVVTSNSSIIYLVQEVLSDFFCLFYKSIKGTIVSIL